MSSCPCKLFKEDVMDLDRRDRVPLVNGLCQNKDKNGILCLESLGSHPLFQSQGSHYY